MVLYVFFIFLTYFENSYYTYLITILGFYKDHLQGQPSWPGHASQTSEACQTGKSNQPGWPGQLGPPTQPDRASQGWPGEPGGTN